MSIETDPIPPLPQHTPPVDQKQGAQQRFTVNWMQWFTAVREKINVINALIVNFSNLVGTGFPALSAGNWSMRTITQGGGVLVTNGDGSAGDPVIAHADTSSVANVAIDNSGVVVLQDVTLTFDTYGHVTGATFNSIDVAAALASTFQPLDATLTAIAGVATAADRIIYFTGVDTAAATALTPFIRTLLDDANQASALTTLGAEAAITAGTSAQFYRGDKTMTNELLGEYLVTLDNTGTGLIGTKYSNDASTFQYRGMKARGTAAVPLGVQSGDALATIQGRGYYTTAGVPTGFTGNIGDIQLTAVEPLTNLARGTMWAFSVTQAGGLTRDDRFRVLYTGVDGGVDNVTTLGSASVRWSALYTVNVFCAGAIVETGVVTMASLGADVNNWVITSMSSIHTVRCGATGAARTITGIASPVSGQRLRLVNITPIDLILAHDNAGSTAANRFACPNSASFTLNGNDSAELWYDITTQRWRVLGA